MEKENLKDSLFQLLKSDFLQEIFYSAFGCGIFTILFFFFPDECWDLLNLSAICAIFVSCFLIIFIVFNQINPRNEIFKVNYKRNIILFSIFCYSIMCFLYFQTNFGTNGILGDNYYRTAYITQMAHSGYPQDFGYKNLSGFIGPFYWYCLALFAKIFYIKPYRMMKLGMLFLYYFLPILLYEVWKKIYSKKISFIITSISFFILFNAYSPDISIVLFFLVPFIIYYFENVTNKKFTKKDYIIAGILGSILFCTYFLYFLLIPIYLLLCFLQNRRAFMKNFKHIAIILIFIIVFSSWFWGPVIRDIILRGFESHQNRYFVGDTVGPEFWRYYAIGLYGIMFFMGLVFIVVNFKKLSDFRSLGNMLIAVNLIYVIGFIGILLKFPIMHFRFFQISFYILFISASLFFVRLFPFLKKSDLFKKRKTNINLNYIESFIFIGLLLTNGYYMIIGTYESPAYVAANEQDVNYNLIDVIEELDYEDKVFLTNNYKVAAYKAIYLFLLPNPYFTHPSALYNERVKFLEDLADCKSSREFYEKVIDNKFDIIDYFWLDTDNNTDFVFEFAIENFPEGRDYYELTFNKELFENTRYFKKHIIDDDIIFETRY
ncbi:MAG: arabinofuranosyltransferase [Promethearchaeota archaeon]